MPFSRPTLTQLRAQAASDIATGVPGADALLRFSNLGVLAQMIAGASYGQYGYLDWIALQAVPWTATDVFLEGWAALKGVYRKPAVAATGSASFAGQNGQIIPTGTAVQAGDGTAYVTTAQGTVAGGGTVTVPIAASVPAAAGNQVSGVTLTLGTAISGIASTGAAAGAITGGADVEGDEALRGRMLLQYSAPPQGGAQADYVEWALAVPGVTRAWCAPLGMGAGTVVVYVMFDVTEASYGGFPQGTNGVATLEERATPATGDQLLVANALWPLRPVTALVYVSAPLPNTVNFTINGLSAASAAVKTAIATAINGVFLAEGSPGGVVDVSYVEAAIAAIAGTAGFVITAITASAGSAAPGPAGNVSSNAGALPTLGTITWL
ncbi:MAG TPA: baseplate J/gp47 family protein [Caulobacteraceae bacterium]|nr:baseplate J/gp47 family protein [Caulobacteraceae bacterium]